MAENVEINFVESKGIDLTGYTLVEGFPGMGLAGTIAAKYLVERKKFEEMGHIEANIFIPIIRIHEGFPVYPSRIYVSRKHKLVVLISEQIIPRFHTDKMAKAVVSWIKERKIARVISLAGIRTDDPQTDKIFGIAANEESKKELQGHGVEIIEDGITTGITALILIELKRLDIEAFSILSNVTMQADYKAAAALIRKLNDILGLEIKVEPLLDEAMETEKALLKHLKDLKKTETSVQQFEEQTPMYT